MDNGNFDPGASAAMSPEDVRLRLLASGFCPTPCVGKRPILKDWQTQHEPTLLEIEGWSRTATAATNTGILTRVTPAFDIDILDPEAAAAVEALVRDRFEEHGDILVRFGLPPKRCIPFRSATPFPKVYVELIPPGWVEGQKLERLEVLSDGQQFVAHGIHPDTHKPYSWYGGEPGEIRHEDLPCIHPEEAQALVADGVKLLVDRFGYRLEPKKAGPGNGNDAGGERWDFTSGALMNHDHLAALAMRIVKSGMDAGATVNLLRCAVADLTNVDEERRQRRLTEIPGMVSSAQAKLDVAGPQIKRVARATLILLGDLRMTPIDWVWEGWLAKGAIHLIAGIPEAGKTTILLSIAAIVASGQRWPDGTQAKVGHVVIWTGEDDPERTIKPRLVQMGADVTKISIVKGTRDEDGKLRPFNPATDLPALTAAAKDIPDGIALLSIDPIASVIGGKVDNSNNAGHREKLQPLVDFADEMGCAVVGVTHFTKGTIGKEPIDRVTGSLAFGAVARIVLVAAKNKSGDPERIFAMAKNNLGPTLGGFGYSIVGSPLMEDQRIVASRIVWGEHIEGSARDLLAEAEDTGKDEPGNAASAQAFLSAALKDGERAQVDVAAEGGVLGFSSGRLFRASKAIGVIKRKETFDGQWMWKLP
jgi:putative DNA primase/helicase